VRNYSNQTDVEIEIDILILRVARQIVRNSKDFLHDKLERTKVEDKNLKKKIKEMEAREKRKKTKRHGNTSDEEEEDGSEVGEDEESKSDSDSSIEERKPKTNKGRKSLPEYSDSEYLPSKSKEKPSAKASKRPPDVPKAKKAPPARPTANKKGVAEYDFDGDMDDGEVDLREGEEVTEIKPDKDGWTVVRNESGEKGKVPSNFIKWSPSKGPKLPPTTPSYCS